MVRRDLVGRVELWAILAIGAALAGWALYSMLSGDGETAPRIHAIDEDALGYVAQTGSTADHGIVISGRDAVFSGLSTTVRIDVQSDDDPGATLRAADIEPWGFAGTAVELVSDEDGFVFRLPAYDESGSAGLVIRRVDTGESPAGRYLSGDWRLPLDLPAEAELPTVMRVETAKGVAQGPPGAGLEIPFRVQRSTSETWVAYELPGGVLEVRPPRLLIDGGDDAREARSLPAAASAPSRDRAWVFPSTPVGTELRFEFGPFDIPDAEDVRAGLTRTVINVLAAAERANVESSGDGWFSITPADVVDGDVDFVRRARLTELGVTRRGVHDAEQVLQLQLARASSPPEVRIRFDRDLPGRGGTGGGVGPRSEPTTVHAVYRDLEDLEAVIVSIGDHSDLWRGPWEATVRFE